MEEAVWTEKKIFLTRIHVYLTNHCSLHNQKNSMKLAYFEVSQLYPWDTRGISEVTESIECLSLN